VRTLCRFCIHVYTFSGTIVRCRSAQIKLGASMEIFPPTSPAIMVHGGCEVQVISNTARSVICRSTPCKREERERDAFIGRAGVPVGAFSFLCVCEVSQGVETTSMHTHLPSFSPFCARAACFCSLFFLSLSPRPLFHFTQFLSASSETLCRRGARRQM
jgi:hypothetical protein